MQHPLLIDCETLQNRVGQPGLVILDVRGRSAYEFGGHIPGAVHVAWSGFLNPDATVKDLAGIKGQLDLKGLNLEHEIACYCTGGVRAGWLYFVLRLAGYARVRNYPGSWWEWSRDFACPVEKDLLALQKLLGLTEETVPTGMRPS